MILQLSPWKMNVRFTDRAYHLVEVLHCSQSHQERTRIVLLQPPFDISDLLHSILTNLLPNIGRLIRNAIELTEREGQRR